MVGYATKLTDQKISENMKWISLSPSYDFSMFPAGIVDDSYIFPTYKDAPNGKVAKIVFDWSKARQVKSFTELQDRPKVIDVVPERSDALIDAGGAFVTNKDKVVVNAVQNAQTIFHIYGLKDGKEIQRLIPNGKCKKQYKKTKQIRSSSTVLPFSLQSKSLWRVLLAIKIVTHFLSRLAPGIHHTRFSNSNQRVIKFKLL